MKIALKENNILVWYNAIILISKIRDVGWIPTTSATYFKMDLWPSERWQQTVNLSR